MSTPLTPEQERARAIIAQAMALPAELREDIAFELLNSVEPPPDDPEEVRKAWREEIARRVEDIEAGRVELVDAKQALAEARQRLRERYGV